MSNKPNITFRPIQPGDAAQVAEIWRAGLSQTYESMSDPMERERVQGFMKEYEERAFAKDGDVGPDGCNLVQRWGGKESFANGCKFMIVAIDDNATRTETVVLGCCGVKRGISEETDIQEKDATEVFSIWRLSVSADARGMGLGRLLMEKAEGWAVEHGGKKMILYTGNPAASSFYQKIGYGLTGAVREFEKILV